MSDRELVPTRADATRNREQLLAAATRVLAAPGAESSMRAIARTAGVGIATLYRHFPTRESLVEAVYRDQVVRLTTGAEQQLSEHAPAVALRRWMDLFGDWVATKNGMLDTLVAMVECGEIAHDQTRTELLTAVGDILDAGRATGDFRADISAEDIAAGLIGIFSTWRAVRYRCAIYAGVGRHYASEPRFFRLQRALLRSRWFDGPVWIYGPPDPERPHLVPSFSPSFDHATWAAAAPAVEAKRASIEGRSPAGPWRLAVVGRLTPNKNQQAAVRAVADLAAAGLDVGLDVLGDGPEREGLEALARDLGLGDRVRFRGMVPLDEVADRLPIGSL